MAREIDCKYVEENNLVALYLAEALPEDTANVFERHYLGCDDCSDELQAGLEVRTAFGPKAGSAGASSSAEPVRKGLPRRDWRLLAAAAAVGVVALAGVLVVVRGRSDPVTTLAAAVGDELPIEARLSGKLSDRKPPAPLRGEPGGTIPRSLRLAGDKAILEAEERPSAHNLHAAGLAHLLLGELDEAVAVLKEASRKDSDPNILSDLSAAFSTRGRRRGDHTDFQNALQAADEALAKDPKLPAALFNNALAVEQIAPFAPEKVRAAWASYLAVDPTSQWAEIARKHIKALPGLAASLPRADPWPEERVLLERALTTGDTRTLDMIVAGFSQQSRIYL